MINEKMNMPLMDGHSSKRGEKMTENETLEQTAKRLNGDLEVAQKAYKSAISAMEKGRNAPIEELVKFADGVASAKSVVSKCEAGIKTNANKIATAEWEAKSGKLREVGGNIGSAVKSVIGSQAKVLSEFGVESITIQVLDVGQDDQEIVVKPQGSGIPRAPRRGGGGTRKSTPLTVDGVEYPSARAADLAFDPDSGPLNRAGIVAKLEKAGKTVS